MLIERFFYKASLVIYSQRVKEASMAKTVQVTYEKGKLYDLNLADVQPDPEQPRKYFDEQALNELKTSIEKHGVLQPVLVRQDGNGALLLVSGERRYQAAKLAGCATIPAVLTDGEPAEISIVENLLRENLTAIEEAEAIEKLRAQHDYGLSELVSVLGKSDSTISEILSLNKLPAEVKDDCRNDPKVFRGILRVIARQKTAEKMIALYRKYKESGLTCGEIIKKAAKPKPADAPIDLAFVDQFYNRLDVLDMTKLTAEQKAALHTTLGQLRSMAYQRMKLLA
jgi:ParB family chromosome partitioning protein